MENFTLNHANITVQISCNQLENWPLTALTQLIKNGIEELKIVLHNTELAPLPRFAVAFFCRDKILLAGGTPCDNVYRQLSEALSRGQWFPRERLSSEQVLMKMYNCSRVTLRATLNRLVKQNLFFRKQGSGTYATDV